MTSYILQENQVTATCPDIHLACNLMPYVEQLTFGSDAKEVANQIHVVYVYIFFMYLKKGVRCYPNVCNI